MNFKKIFFLAASVALLAIVVVAAVSFFTPGRELWADTAVFSELGPGAEAAFPGFISVTEDTREVQYVPQNVTGSVGIILSGK